MERILYEIYLFFVFPFWFIILLLYIFDTIIRFIEIAKKSLKISFHQKLCVITFAISFILSLSIDGFINTIVVITTAIFALCNYILPHYKIKDFKASLVIKRVLDYLIASIK